MRIVDIDHIWRRFHLGERVTHDGRKLAVADEDFRLGMLQNICQSTRIEPVIQGVEHTSGHGHAKMRLVKLWRVGGQYRDDVTFACACFYER